MKYEQIKETFIQETEKYLDVISEISDYMADNPEISGHEYETSKMLAEFLRKEGFDVEYPFGGKQTAFRAIYGKNDHKYKIALLTEYDALPEIGHACGHCLSGTASVLAGIALRDIQDNLDADVHIIGTPDEEDDGAKCIMVENGIFDAYDMAIMVHMYNNNIIMPRFQALGEFFYEFTGKAAHASAAPWEGQNALNAVQLMLHATDMLRQHTKPDAQFHSIIKEGGVFPNIVPEKAVIHMFIRAASKKYLEELIRLTDDCAKGASIATQTKWKRTPKDQLYYVDLRRNETGEKTLREVFSEMGIPENGPKDKIFGSSDIGNVSYACPAFHPCLEVTDVPIHTREFADAMKTEMAHSVIQKSACIIGLFIIKTFMDENKIHDMKADFAENL